jgi:Divergent InlB B-repeat domain
VKRVLRIPLLVGLVASIAWLPNTAHAAGTFTLTVTKSGNGSGGVTSAPTGIDCGLTCSADMPAGGSVDLTATPDAGSVFDGWSAPCSGTGLCTVPMDGVTSVTAAFRLNVRPDAMIRLCGAGDTCLGAPAHKYRGQNIYNRTGKRQTYPAGMEEGNDIRFWILIQNDGAQADRIFVKGCKGNKAFVIRAVIVGAWRYSTGHTHIDHGFKTGTASFQFAPAASQANVVITLDIWETVAIQGLRYTCPITITSSNDPTVTDRVVAKMVTT